MYSLDCIGLQGLPRTRHPWDGRFQCSCCPHVRMAVIRHLIRSCEPCNGRAQAQIEKTERTENLIRRLRFTSKPAVAALRIC